MAPAQPAAPPSHTRRFTSSMLGDSEMRGSLVFAADATEPRGQVPAWEAIRRREPNRCMVITRQGRSDIDILSKSTQTRVLLRDDASLRDLIGTEDICIDISGLAHQVWAPLLRVALDTSQNVTVIYAEPQGYKPHPNPFSPTRFDLSTSFDGLAPLPGMARLAGPAQDRQVLLVAFLGFEGARALRLALELDPAPKVIPVVGVPGFRIEYPSFTIACNRDFLDEYRAHSDIRLARASCPFEAYGVLAALAVDYPQHYFYIAPVGTKPHSLGAIMYALENPDRTEVLYDHPVRKPGRTMGIGTIHQYRLKPRTDH